MKSTIGGTGTIGNPGDIQPDAFSFRDFDVLDPGAVLASPSETSVGPALLETTGLAGITPDIVPPAAPVTSLSTEMAPSSVIITEGPVMSVATTFAPLVITPVFGSS